MTTILAQGWLRPFSRGRAIPTLGDGDRAVVLAGDACAWRDVRLPGSDFLEERVAWDSVRQGLHA
jgi:uncharacterized Rossmann fold enzyme